MVLDASPRANSWCEAMPEATQELPLPTLAFVYGVDDPQRIKQGAREYFSVAQQALDIARRLHPDEVASIKLPTPETTAVSGGEIFHYALPAMLKANDRIAPNAALGEDVLVLSLLPEVSEKLLASARPTLDGPLADFDRPLLSASHIKTAQLIDSLKPWINYGVKVAIEKQQEAGGEVQQAVAMVGFIRPQVHEILDVLKVFSAATTVSYLDGDVVIRHSETRVIDLEP